VTDWEVEMADAELDRANAVKSVVERDILSRPGVTGVGVGLKKVGGELTGTVAIRVYVARKRTVPEHEHIPPEINGVAHRCHRSDVCAERRPYEVSAFARRQ
jgi:hypothetical protein